MARKVRVFIENTPQHIILKSIDNTILFKDESDYLFFIDILNNLTSKIDIYIHSYVLMPKYFEFLATPKDDSTISKFMQSLGRQYVWYFNKKYNRTGTLWEGRYKSSLVEDRLYLFEIMRYIESLPKIDNIILDEKEYKYSSIQRNLFNKKDSIITYHNLYKKLGFTQSSRIKNYFNIFYSDIEKQKRDFIITSLEKQLVTGSFEYIKELEKLAGLTLISKNRGRPKKEKIKKVKKMYKNLVVLDKEKHKELKISPLENLNFAKDNSFVPVIANEVALIGANFPVVFSADENPSLVSLVSLGGDSLAINTEGKWITPYVPSFFRKYPFSIASTKENANQKVILIDEESSLFSKSKGKQLFKKSGEQSDTLAHAIKFLTSHEQQMTITKNIAKLIANSGILEDREISVGEGDEKKVLVNGFKVVDRDKLNGLSDDILADWVRKGIISVIDAHLKSLDNIQTLFNIAQQRQN
ncbi:MAG: SapC family protein [Campylobacterota bacterium]|nr:SapC family protein [Campylobacterota bacterium]